MPSENTGYLQQSDVCSVPEVVMKITFLFGNIFLCLETPMLQFPGSVDCSPCSDSSETGPLLAVAEKPVSYKLKTDPFKCTWFGIS